MATTATTPFLAKRIAGGSFLLEHLKPEDVFTPEDFSDEQRQIAQTARDFAMQEIVPASDQIEAKNFAVTRALMKKTGDLGLLAIDVPEEYGGLELDKVTSALACDMLALQSSFTVAYSAHVGIGTLPLVWYGTEEQKKKYLPKLAAGEWVAAYALSESTSGSDAMNVRTKAVLSPDGQHYILNGEKMWTSNAGFADLFTVFAKIDGEKFTAFLIERNTPGLTIGAEEHKLGIRGSSTCPLVLSDCKVPVGNLLGEAGKGHHIAFNVLNYGRFKLASGCIGGARHCMTAMIGYAKERKAFGKSISEFGLIQEKLANSATALYAAETMSYRTVGTIDAALAELDKSAPDYQRQVQKAIEEYAVECSILKVAGSEMLDEVVDHFVQIFAGYGYVEEYPAERAYRDARINRIFEGTNEINRLIITGFLMKRALTGKLALLPAIQKLMDEVMSGPTASEEIEGPLAAATKLLAQVRKLTLFAAGAASQKYMQALADQQEIMAALADSIIAVFALDSCILRAEKIAAARGESAAAQAIALTNLQSARSMETAEMSARKVIAEIAEGDMLRTQMAIVRRLSKADPVNTIAWQREVSARLVEAGKYVI
jgi:alkylation response protein AidB-like acyl-CoA dehydrogenase